VPVLARLFEAAGMATVLLTNMPFWAEKVGVPRTLAVEFPFGHLVGQPGNVAQQRRVIDQALHLLEKAEAPGTIHHSPEQWPTSFEEALQASHPPQPPPVMAEMGRHIFDLMRGLRRS
jgi:hypothetical protein